MTPATLTRNLIDDTSQLKLIVRLGSDALSVLIAEPASGCRGAECRVSATPGAIDAPYAEGIKKLVYDNELLLADFDSVDIIFTTHECFTAPKGTEELHEAMAGAMLPDYDSEREILSEDFGDGTLCYAVDAGLLHFLTRTFANARFHHSLAIAAARLPMAADGVFAICEADDMTLLRRSEGRVGYLNFPPVYSPADCAYYILAETRGGDDIFLAADPARLEKITNLIGQVNPDAGVLPLTLPENQVKLRNDSAAPLDMIMLCE